MKILVLKRKNSHFNIFPFRRKKQSKTHFRMTPLAKFNLKIIYVIKTQSANRNVYKYCFKFKSVQKGFLILKFSFMINIKRSKKKYIKDFYVFLKRNKQNYKCIYSKTPVSNQGHHYLQESHSIPNSYVFVCFTSEKRALSEQRIISVIQRYPLF